MSTQANTSTPWGPGFDTPKVVDRTFEDNLEAERDAAIAKINARAERQREHQLKLVKLSKAVTDAEGCLVEFEAKKAFFIQRKQQLISQLPTFWSMRKGDLSTQLNFDPLLGIVESHGTLLAIDEALANAPKVSQELAVRLETAKRALANFQRSSN